MEALANIQDVDVKSLCGKISSQDLGYLISDNRL